MGNSNVRILMINQNESIQFELLKALTVYSDSESAGEVELVMDSVGSHKEAIKKANKLAKDGEQYSVIYINQALTKHSEILKLIKSLWQLDLEIQFIIATDPSNYDWDHGIKKIGIGDNYLVLSSPIDSLALRQILKALVRKWILTKQVKYHSEIIDKTVKEQTHNLQHSISLLRSTIDSTTDGILVIDLNNKIIDYNKKFLSMWNISDSFAASKDWKLMFNHMNKQLVTPLKFKVKKI